MSGDNRLLSAATAEHPVDLLSDAPELNDSAVAVAVRSTGDVPASVAAGPTTSPAAPPIEIDVGDVVAHLRRVPAPDADELPDFSVECAVQELSTADRHLVAVDACPVCGTEWARARYGLPGVRFQIVDCTSCGLGRLHPRPTSDVIARFYPASYYGVTGAKFVPLIEGLVRLVRRAARPALSRGSTPGAGARRRLRPRRIAFGARRARI